MARGLVISDVAQVSLFSKFLETQPTTWTHFNVYLLELNKSTYSGMWRMKVLLKPLYAMTLVYVFDY